MKEIVATLEEGLGEALIRDLDPHDQETVMVAVLRGSGVTSDTMIVVRLADPIDQGRILPLR